jgi:hypothetical protein
MKRIALSLAWAVALTLPTVAEAQGGPGFLFNRPRVSIGIRTGYSIPRAESPIFRDAFQQFKLNGWDLASPYLGGELAVRVSERWDVALTGGWARSRSSSEYREWVDQDLLPIEQETTFRTASTTLGGRYYFSDRGRSVGRFAWVPARLTPFVGAGAGYTWYDFMQRGDFVDFQTLDIVGDELRTNGSGATAYASAGADFSVGKQFFLTGEARYNLASGAAQGEYSAYDGIDLSGLQVTAGISVRW